MMMQWLKIIAINLLIFALILGGLELSIRIFAPEYVNAYFTNDVSRGNPIHHNTKWGHRVGAAQIDQQLTRKTPFEQRVLFIGDSVTYGYGLPYEDSYHEVAGRMLEKQGCKTVVHGVGRLHSTLETLLASEDGDFILH